MPIIKPFRRNLKTTCYAGGLDSFKEKYQDYYNAIDKKMPDFLK
jgi:hypothetical protein